MEAGNGRRVAVIEHADRPDKKILISGGRADVISPTSIASRTEDETEFVERV